MEVAGQDEVHPRFGKEAFDQRHGGHEGPFLFAGGQKGVVDGQEAELFRRKMAELGFQAVRFKGTEETERPVQVEAEGRGRVRAGEVGQFAECGGGFFLRENIFPITAEGGEKAVDGLVQSRHVMVSGDDQLRARELVQPLPRRLEFPAPPAHREVPGNHGEVRVYLARHPDRRLCHQRIRRAEMRVGVVEEADGHGKLLETSPKSDPLIAHNHQVTRQANRF